MEAVGGPRHPQDRPRRWRTRSGSRRSPTDVHGCASAIANRRQRRRAGSRPRACSQLHGFTVTSSCVRGRPIPSSCRPYLLPGPMLVVSAAWSRSSAIRQLSLQLADLVRPHRVGDRAPVFNRRLATPSQHALPGPPLNCWWMHRISLSFDAPALAFAGSFIAVLRFSEDGEGAR